MWRVVILGVLLAGCAAPSVSWCDDVPTIRPRALSSARLGGSLLVRTFPQGGRQSQGDGLNRGFRVLDADGVEVYRTNPFDEDWDRVRLFPGRYMVLSFVGDSLFGRRWEKAQVVIEGGKVTVVDFRHPGPREIIE